MATIEDSLVVKIGADISDYQARLKEASRMGERFGATLTRAFESAVFQGKDLGDVLRNLALSLSRMALRAAFRPLEQAAGTFLSQMLAGMTGYAQGGVPGSYVLSPFAQGGVITAPMAFPLGRRHVGIAGEAGAEAILPLARGKDGRLGVRSSGGDSPIAINVTITTSDLDSFRRSESQVAAMLARAVARGRRNM